MKARAAQACTTAMIDEASLVAAARVGDEAAVRELIRRLNPRLFRIARGIVGNDAEAEEVVQDSYLAAFTGLTGFRDKARFSTWITRITLNAARMRTRSHRPTEEYNTVTEDTSQVVAFPGTTFEQAEAALGRTQIRNLLEAALDELPPDLRLPFVLHEAEGMSVRQIAADLDLLSVTVRTRLYRARRRLRVALEKRMGGGFDAVFPFDGQRCVHMADRVIRQLQQRGF